MQILKQVKTANLSSYDTHETFSRPEKNEG